MEDALCVPVRLQLASTLSAFLTTASHWPDSVTLSVRKKKKSGVV